MSASLTEEHLSAVFESALSHGAWAEQYPSFRLISRELECFQGRPDFVASIANVPAKLRTKFTKLAAALATPSSAKVLSLLKFRAPRTETYLFRTSGLSVPVLRRALRELEALGFVERTERTSYLLSNAFPDTTWELWAFEVKLSDWKRALYQALQYRAFAHSVAIVVPEVRAHRVERQLDRFKTLDVGVIAVDARTGSLRSLLKPTRRRPASRFQQLLALGKFLGQSYPRSHAYGPCLACQFGSAPATSR